MSRILLSAYACEPAKGSEPALGWMWATELASLGHDVWVITRASNRAAVEADPASRQGNPHFAFCDLPEWARRWKHLPGGLYFYYFLWQWLAYREARRLHRVHRFDLVHHVTWVSLRAPSFMGRLGIPFYFGPVSGGERVPKLLRRDMSRRAEAVELVRECANRLLRLDPLMLSAFRRADRIYITSRDSLPLIPVRFHTKCAIQLAVGLHRKQLGFSRRSIASTHNVLRCLYAGRLLEWKGLWLALLAMQRLKELGVPAHLTLIGDGPAAPQLKSLALQLGITGTTTFLPWLPQEELQRQHQHHHVFLFPSLRDSGGMAVLEALAHGLPVVCTDRGGPGAIVNDRCGRIVPASGRSSQVIACEFAEQMQRLAQNPGLVESLSINARRRAWEFEFGRTVEAIYGRGKGNELEEFVSA